MPVYLGEEYCGVGDDLVFPNISSCVAVVVLDVTGVMGGAHLTKFSPRSTIESIGRFLQAGLPGRAVADLVAVGMLSDWKSNPDTLFPAALKRTLASAFGYSGIIRYHDLVQFKKGFTLTGAQGIVVRAYTKDKDGGRKIKVEYGGPGDYARGTNVTAPAGVFSASTKKDIAPASATANFDRTRVTAVKHYTEYPVQGALTKIKSAQFKSL